MHLKVFVKLKKTLKTLSSGQKTQKNPKNPKNPKKPEKTHWAGFFLKKPGFFPTLVLMTKILKNLQLKKKFGDQKLQFTFPLVSIKDDQVTKEAFSSQKRTSSTSKHKISYFFSTFVGRFCPPGSGSGFRIRIRIH